MTRLPGKPERRAPPQPRDATRRDPQLHRTAGPTSPRARLRAPPPPRTLVPEPPPPPAARDSSGPVPIVRRGRPGPGLAALSPGPLPDLPQEGAARGMPLPVLSAAVRPTSLGLAPRGSSRRRRPPPTARRPPGSGSAAAHGPRPRPCGWAPAGGPRAPHTRPRVLSPAAFRALGGARSRDPSASLRPAAAPPAASPGRDAPLCATITPTRRAPTPRGSSANGSSPGPGPTCTAQPSLEWGGGRASFRPPLSLIGPSRAIRERHWLRVDVCQSCGAGRWRGGGEMLVPRRLCLCISLSLSRP